MGSRVYFWLEDDNIPNALLRSLEEVSKVLVAARDSVQLGRYDAGASPR